MELVHEKKTTYELLNEAIEYGEKHGVVSAKKLASKLRVSPSTGAKLTSALRIRAILGERTKKGYLFAGRKNFGRTESSVIIEKIKNADDYEITFYRDLLFPAVKVAFEWGNVGVAMLERKLGLDYHRAQEVFDLLDAVGVIGEESTVNPGRRNLALRHEEFDELVSE